MTMEVSIKPKPELIEQLSSNSLKDSLKGSFKGLTRRRRQTSRKISRVKQLAVTEKYVKSMNEHAQNDLRRKTDRTKLMKFLWKDVKACETENINMTLDYDVVDLRDLDPQGTLLKYAVANSYMDVVAVLLRHSSPIEASGEDGLSPLHLAIKLGNISILAMILANNPPINVRTLYEQKTALHVAVRMNSTEALNLLLEYGADPNKPDIYESTPLHLAARLGRDHLIKLLIKHGASVFVIDNEGWTPMHVSSEAGHATCVRIFLEHHSFVDAQSKYGKTSLHWACEKGHLQVVQALLDGDASTVIPALNNKTACDYALTPLLRNLLDSYTKKSTNDSLTECVPRKNYFDCRLRNKSLIDLIDLSQFTDPYAHRLNESMIGRGAMQDERSKPITHRAKTMPYMLELRHESDVTEHSASSPDLRRQHNQRPDRVSIKSSLSFQSFATVSESDLDFGLNPNCESVPMLSLPPIKEETRHRPSLDIDFKIGDSTFSDSASTTSPEIFGNHTPDTDATESITIPVFMETNHNIETSTPEDDTQQGQGSFRCKVSIATLIETLDEIHNKIDTSVQENVDVLSDIFRDVVILRHRENDVGLAAREKAFDNIEKNIKHVVVRLKQLKSQVDNQVLDL